jgi:hypothetical protein
MIRVNYGAPLIWERCDPAPGVVFVRAAHDGPDGHELLQDGEQCECGQMKIGIRP